MLVQCIALKMLTDFTLMYTSAVGLILRRDAEAPTRGGSPRGKTPRKDAPRQTGVLLRYLPFFLFFCSVFLLFACAERFSVTVLKFWLRKPAKFSRAWDAREVEKSFWHQRVRRYMKRSSLCCTAASNSQHSEVYNCVVVIIAIPGS